MYFLYKVLKQEGFGVYVIYGDLGTRRPPSHRMKMVAYYQQCCSKCCSKCCSEIEIEIADNIEELSVTFFPDCFVFSAFDHSFEEKYPKNTAQARDLILGLFLKAKCLSA